MMAATERRSGRCLITPERSAASMRTGANKFLIAAVTVIGVAIQIVWAAALSYPLALAVISITHSLTQL